MKVSSRLKLILLKTNNALKLKKAFGAAYMNFFKMSMQLHRIKTKEQTTNKINHR